MKKKYIIVLLVFVIATLYPFLAMTLQEKAVYTYNNTPTVVLNLIYPMVFGVVLQPIVSVMCNKAFEKRNLYIFLLVFANVIASICWYFVKFQLSPYNIVLIGVAIASVVFKTEKQCEN
ncbi:MAG: hypothetical protein LBQ95_01570 [Lachnospiraceae bacterium]|nr:hypothetical protein [Lachnospiraceae bacterium]